jgi:DNA-binding transcriptional ArsR family regulator
MAVKSVMATDQLSLTFAALADPTRRRILGRLAEGEATVSELAEPFSISLPAISRHLKVLERAGLISRRREAQSRPTSLRLEALQEAEAWMDTCRATWERRVDRLDEHLRERLKGEDSG